VNGFAAYRPEQARRTPNQRISVRPMSARDIGACARLIVSRTAGPIEARQEKLRADLSNPDRYSVVACAGSDPDGPVVGYAAVILHERTPHQPPTTAPTGYYLVGLIVDPRWRRHGIGELLTVDRMAWTAERADAVWYFANIANGATLDLHRRFGFVEVTRDFTFPNAPLAPGTGVLLRAPLPLAG
jgi:ribosomal protein S18 acetylase RimI-like enzyme